MQDDLPLLSPDILDKIWIQWLKNEKIDFAKYWYFTATYQYCMRGSELTQRFENWLLEQGGQIFVRNHQRCIKINDAEKASFLLLKYS